MLEVSHFNEPMYIEIEVGSNPTKSIRYINELYDAVTVYPEGK